MSKDDLVIVWIYILIYSISRFGQDAIFFPEDSSWTKSQIRKSFHVWCMIWGMHPKIATVEVFIKFYMFDDSRHWQITLVTYYPCLWQSFSDVYSTVQMVQEGKAKRGGRSCSTCHNIHLRGNYTPADVPTFFNLKDSTQGNSVVQITILLHCNNYKIY